MSFGQFLSILRARFWIALLVFVMVVGATVGVSLWLPKQYTGTASVVLDLKPDPVSALGIPTMAGPTLMATQVDIMTSDRVATRVIRDLKLLESAEVRQQWQDETKGQGAIEQWLTDRLQRRLDVKPSRESNVIQVSYNAPDPRFAAALANAFAQAYIATTLELRVDPARQFNTFFVAQSKEARDALERAQARLSAFQREKGIIATDERLDVENARLNELSSQLVQMQAITNESASRLSQAQGSSSDRMQEVLNSGLISGLKADLTRGEARLQELNAKYGDNHPQVIEAKANIAEVRSRLEAETRKVTGGVAVTNTINKQREAQLRRELETQRAAVLRMKAVRDEGLVMQREVENAQRIYDSLMARLNQTALESQTTQSFVNLLTSAQAPSAPSSPKVLLNTVLAVFMGLLLGMGASLLTELADRRVRGTEDIVHAVGLPVLGALPKPSAKRFISGSRALPVPRQVAMALPNPDRAKGF